MSKDCYNNVCPIAMACELLQPRWTLLVLCEMWWGSTHFNDIRRGVPSMSPTLLSKRLKEMEKNGLIYRSVSGSGSIEYKTTPIANELEPIIEALGKWAHRNVDADVTMDNLDAKVLMWNMRRKVNTAVLPKNRRSVIQFIYPDLPEGERNYWIIARPGAPVDVCYMEPGFDVDLYITTNLKTMASAWLGHTSLRGEVDRGTISLIGDETLVASLCDWMVVSSYAA
jgi:DNA-binding HxlR family transcriptional regulator